MLSKYSTSPAGLRIARGPHVHTLDIMYMWLTPRVRAYLKTGSRLLIGHWVGKPLGESQGGALQSKSILF